jgi:hypothetical protein
MDALKDVSWMKYLYAGTVAERFNWGGYSIASAIAPTGRSGIHDRYKFRMFIFEGAASAPCAVINLETDLLGLWKLSAQLGDERTVLASFDQAPDYDAFRSLAIAAMDGLPGLKPRQGAKKTGARASTPPA